MKYKILLTGNNKTIIDDFFSKAGEDFEYQSTSARYEDILSHIKYFHPNGFLYCLNHEMPDSFRRISELKQAPESADTAFFIIGTRGDCDAYSRTAPGAADMVMEKPMSTGNMEERMRAYFSSLPETAASRSDDTAGQAGRIPQETQPMMGKAPQAASQPQAGKASQEALQPQAGKAPQAASQPQAGKAPQAASQPQAGKAPQAASQPQAEKTPQAASQPQAEKTPQAVSQPQAGKAPQAASQPQAGKAPQAAQPAASQPVPAVAPSQAASSQPQKDVSLSDNAVPQGNMQQPASVPVSAPEEDPNAALLSALSAQVSEAASLLDSVGNLDLDLDPVGGVEGVAVGSTGRKHILVVDDDSRMLKIIQRHLADKYDVATALNGKIAFKFLENRKTDLILLDYEMPLESGPTVLKRLRENPLTRDIPVIFLTGISDRNRIEKALALKPQGYLLKPIDHIKLLSTISKFID